MSPSCGKVPGCTASTSANATAVGRSMLLPPSLSWRTPPTPLPASCSSQLRPDPNPINTSGETPTAFGGLCLRPVVRLTWPMVPAPACCSAGWRLAPQGWRMLSWGMAPGLQEKQACPPPCWSCSRVRLNGQVPAHDSFPGLAHPRRATGEGTQRPGHTCQAGHWPLRTLCLQPLLMLGE